MGVCASSEARKGSGMPFNSPVVAFYYPGYAAEVDRAYGAGFLGNFYLKPLQLEAPCGGVGRFRCLLGH